jgi:NAD(P)-dependent dehydrogenase (short-subunit alcohol dehydrogenase family)
VSDFDLAGKICIVTGAGRGIGRGIAEALARHGGIVVLSGRNKERLDLAADAIGARARTHVADVTNEEQVIALRDAVLARYGRIDVLVNNAGVNPVWRGI